MVVKELKLHQNLVKFVCCQVLQPSFKEKPGLLLPVCFPGRKSRYKIKATLYRENPLIEELLLRFHVNFRAKETIYFSKELAPLKVILFILIVKIQERRKIIFTVELQLLEDLWSHENMFQTRVVRANEC